jgi:ADP-ribose pyrophosphatase YjhB (NUDIX family)
VDEGVSGITVAVGAIIADGDRFLLIRRGHAPSAGLWSIPGGRVEVGETLPDALRREIREECGVDVEVGDVAILLDRISLLPDGTARSHYLILDFWAARLSGEPVAGTDAAEVGWFTLDQMRQLPTTNRLPAYIEAALRRRAAGQGPIVVAD